ncbi:MAG: YihY/virulence factor BrkB family protein [Planctomycetaceae bacterium]|nr:YihY/virulence factor BrkB family protein [Planctomycetaceae bacterium]
MSSESDEKINQEASLEPGQPISQSPVVSKPQAIEHGKRWLMDFFPNLRDAGLRWTEDDAGSLAASVAYYLALSLFPMFLLLFSGLGIFLRYTQSGFDIQQQILETVENQTTPEVRSQVDQVLDSLTSQSLVGGPTGLITAILAAIGVFAQIDRGFDKIFRIAPQKDRSLFWTIIRVLRQRFSAFLMLLSLGGLMVVLFFVSMGVAHLSNLAQATGQLDGCFSRRVASGDCMGSWPRVAWGSFYRHAVHECLWCHRIVHRLVVMVLLWDIDPILWGRVRAGTRNASGREIDPRGRGWPRQPGGDCGTDRGYATGGDGRAYENQTSAGRLIRARRSSGAFAAILSTPTQPQSRRAHQQQTRRLRHSRM